VNDARIMLWIGCVFLFSLSVSLLCVGCARKESPPSRPPQVKVARVVEKDVSIYGEWVATLDGNVNAQIQPQVTGYLVKQDYSEGSFVHKDDVIFEIDPRPFQAVLDQAKAQLAQAEAQLSNATLNDNRDIPEAEANAIARSQLEGDTQAQLAAKATAVASRAAVEQAALNLSFAKVRSLISGIAGIAQVQVGNLVTPAGFQLPDCVSAGPRVPRATGVIDCGGRRCRSPLENTLPAWWHELPAGTHQ
jgi:multidrug efflux pump subunit AcrA (membrane-fusion protein)